MGISTHRLFPLRQSRSVKGVSGVIRVASMEPLMVTPTLPAESFCTSLKVPVYATHSHVQDVGRDDRDRKRVDTDGYFFFLVFVTDEVKSERSTASAMAL
jgi:hypothetical protein